MASYRTTILGESSLVGYWPLQETSGTSAVDLVAGNNGTYTGGYTLGQGGPGTRGMVAVELNGSTGYVTIPTSSAISPTAAITVEAWVRVPGSGNTSFNRIVAKPVAGNAAPFSDYNLDTWNNNNLDFALALNGTSVPFNTAAGGLTPGSWLYVVGVYDGTGAGVYQNAVSIGGAPATGTIGTHGQALRIGSNDNANFLNGRVAHVAIYNAALSPARITVHYNAIDGVDGFTMPLIVGQAVKRASFF